jgi:hypothetical protein
MIEGKAATITFGISVENLDHLGIVAESDRSVFAIFLAAAIVISLNTMTMLKSVLYRKARADHLFRLKRHQMHGLPKVFQ